MIEEDMKHPASPTPMQQLVAEKDEEIAQLKEKLAKQKAEAELVAGAIQHWYEKGQLRMDAIKERLLKNFD